MATARPAPVIASKGENHDQSKRRRRAAARTTRYADRPARRRRAEDFRRAQYPARRHVCALLEDQEFPLAYVRPSLPRLSSPPRRTGRADLRHHRRHGRTRTQDRRDNVTLDRPHRPLAAGVGQRRGVRHAVDMLAELRDDNKQLVSSLREAHPICDKHNDVASASLIENWIDEAERRTWFLFEATRVVRE